MSAASGLVLTTQASTNGTGRTTCEPPRQPADQALSRGAGPRVRGAAPACDVAAVGSRGVALEHGADAAPGIGHHPGRARHYLRPQRPRARAGRARHHRLRQPDADRESAAGRTGSGTNARGERRQDLPEARRPDARLRVCRTSGGPDARRRPAAAEASGLRLLSRGASQLPAGIGGSADPRLRRNRRQRAVGPGVSIQPRARGPRWQGDHRQGSEGSRDRRPGRASGGSGTRRVPHARPQHPGERRGGPARDGPQVERQSASAIVLDPRTGAILAMAVQPGYDANRFAAAPVDLQRNRTVTDTYEPGSTYKLITVAGALSERIVQPTTRFTLPYSLHVADR